MVGPAGQVVGVDMTPAMLEKARAAAADSGVDNLEFREAYMEELPVADGWADVVISNGVLNLTPDKQKTLGEMFRVLRSGGRLQIATSWSVGRCGSEEEHRSVDRLNRRCSAGSRARGDGRRRWLHRFRNHLEGRSLRRRAAGV